LELGLRSEQLDWLFLLAWLGAEKGLAEDAEDIFQENEWFDLE
jgi:hypothetical protein